MPSSYTAVELEWGCMRLHEITVKTCALNTFTGTSPFQLQNLSVGRHRLKITPVGCLSNSSPFSVKFTVNSNGQ